jgi:hypothetical protein
MQLGGISPTFRRNRIIQLTAYPLLIMHSTMKMEKMHFSEATAVRTSAPTEFILLYMLSSFAVFPILPTLLHIRSHFLFFERHKNKIQANLKNIEYTVDYFI